MCLFLTIDSRFNIRYFAHILMKRKFVFDPTFTLKSMLKTSFPWFTCIIRTPVDWILASEWWRSHLMFFHLHGFLLIAIFSTDKWNILRCLSAYLVDCSRDYLQGSLVPKRTILTTFFTVEYRAEKSPNTLPECY